jgi:hypothetical protein
MTADDFRAQCIALINRLLVHGFARPIAFAAIDSTGLTTSGSSETVTGTLPVGRKTATPHGSFTLYLLPIHCLFVDPQGHAAHAVLDGSGSDALRLLT